VGDDAGDGGAAEKKPGPLRNILLSLAAAGIVGALLVSYLVKSIKLPEGPVLVATSDDGGPGADTLAIAQRVAGAFVEALRVGDTAGAYAQMARPYREGASLAKFREAWRTPLLASPHAVRLSRSYESAVPVDGKLVKGVTFTARGMLIAAAGALDTTFTFLHEGDEAHVLAVFVGGVPIVQGLGPSAPAP
jgi:hypothetical protein